jgi:hypothetical protein
MPTVTADKIIGKGLIAKVTIAKLNGALSKIGTFAPGDAIGVVYSYIQRGTNLYWMIQPQYGAPYYVLHGVGRFELTDDIKNAINKQKVEREKENRETEIQQKGEIPYYLEKYGKIVLAVAVGAYLLNTYIKKRA